MLPVYKRSAVTAMRAFRAVSTHGRVAGKGGIDG
jgi:hypothetical protein